MFSRRTLLAAAVAAFAMPAFAEGTIAVTDAYARFMPGAMAGAAFMTITNSGAEADRLTDVRSDIAAKTELHTHIGSADGKMQMVHVPEGFEIPANGSHDLKRGGDHVMFMGLKSRPENGQTVSVTLVFEKAGEMVIDVPVDSMR